MNEDRADAPGAPIAESEFERRTRALLQDSADALPAAVRSRLTQARFAALEGRRSPAAAAALTRRWMGAGAATAAVLVALLLLAPRTEGPGVPAPAGGSLEDLELLAESDAVPLNDDQSTDQDVDYDFYEWAANEADSADPSAVGS